MRHKIHSKIYKIQRWYSTIYHLIAVLIVGYNTTMMLKTVTTQLATLQQKYHLLQSRFQTFSNLSMTRIGLKI